MISITFGYIKQDKESPFDGLSFDAWESGFDIESNHWMNTEKPNSK